MHTDDYLCVTNNPSWFDEFFQHYNSVFSAERRDIVDSFCGISLDIQSDKILFSQEGTIRNYLSSLKRDTQILPRDTPCKESALNLPKNTQKDSSVPYESAIGSHLWFARMTRPDISFATIYHAKYTACSTWEHYESVLDCARYLEKTSHYQLAYSKSGTNGFKIKVMTDADWAEDKDDRKSYQSYIVFLNDKPIIWNCSKQSVVATSTFEAEYMALAEGVKAALYLKNLLSGIIELEDGPIELWVDNKAAKAFAENEGCNQRTKHVDIRYHFVRDYIQKGEFAIRYVESASNTSDLLTKPLPAATQFKHSATLLDVTERGGVTKSG